MRRRKDTRKFIPLCFGPLSRTSNVLYQVTHSRKFSFLSYFLVSDLVTLFSQTYSSTSQENKSCLHLHLSLIRIPSRRPFNCLIRCQRASNLYVRRHARCCRYPPHLRHSRPYLCTANLRARTRYGKDPHHRARSHDLSNAPTWPRLTHELPRAEAYPQSNLH